MMNTETATTTGATAAQSRILVVDDEPGMLMVTKAVLESLNLEPVLVASGEEALEAFRAFSRRRAFAPSEPSLAALSIAG